VVNEKSLLAKMNNFKSNHLAKMNNFKSNHLAKMNNSKATIWQPSYYNAKKDIMLKRCFDNWFVGTTM
jgi:REP element-mobilizing transposase RayT